MGMRRQPGSPTEAVRFERGCEGKEAFDSESGAAAALRLYQRLRRLRTGDGLVPYPCEFCGKWHIGHSAPPGLRQRRQAG